MKTANAVRDGFRMTDEQEGILARRFREITRRINEGTIEFDWAASEAQKIIENGIAPLWWCGTGYEASSHDGNEGIVDQFSRNGEPGIYLDWNDIKAIRDQGVEFFRKHFAGKVVIGWASVENHRDSFNAPIVFERDGYLVMDRTYREIRR